jgi:hypothetical protein
MEETGHPRPGDVEWERDVHAVTADVCLDNPSFRRLVLAQIARTKARLDQQYAQPGGIQDRRTFSEQLGEDSGMLGRMLALRKEIQAAKQDRSARDSDEIKEWIDKGIGLLPIPYADKFGGVTKEAYELVVRSGYSKVGEWLGDRVAAEPASANTEVTRLRDEDNLIDLTKQMLLSSATRATFPSAGLRGKSFAPLGAISSPATWTDEQTDAFLAYCKEHNVPVYEASDIAENAISRSHPEAMDAFARSAKGWK